MSPGALVMKPVIPRKLKDDAMRLALLNPMRKVGDDIKVDFEATVGTWTDKPKFKMERHLNSKQGFLAVTVWTDHQHYSWVSKGTKAHYVPRTGKAMMAFKRYKAKTMVRVIGSKAGGRFGDTIFRYGRWLVKGITAREFDKVIRNKWQPEFSRRMSKAMREAAEASGLRR